MRVLRAQLVDLVAARVVLVGGAPVLGALSQELGEGQPFGSGKAFLWR